VTEAIMMDGQRYGRLNVLKHDGLRKGRNFYLCRCDCGKECSVLGARLRSGKTSSCGCFHRERISEANTKHGRSRTTEYGIWTQMRARCENPSNRAYQGYGGRGIRVCERWEEFSKFIADMGERPSSDYSLDRIDNNGNYEPANCRWATRAEQSSNRRNNIRVTIDNKEVTLAEAARMSGISGLVVWKRVRRGWPIEKALYEPIRKSRQEKDKWGAGVEIARAK